MCLIYTCLHYMVGFCFILPFLLFMNGLRQKSPTWASAKGWRPFVYGKLMTIILYYITCSVYVSNIRRHCITGVGVHNTK